VCAINTTCGIDGNDVLVSLLVWCTRAWRPRDFWSPAQCGVSWQGHTWVDYSYPTSRHQPPWWLRQLKLQCL